MVVIKRKLTFFSKTLLNLLSILNKHDSESRFIGGCVRDALLDRKSADIDIATTLLPQQVIQALTDNKIPFVTIGMDFGTITAFIKNEHIEITTLRKDLSSNGRHPKVIYTESFEEDAKRRDFTINSLSYCPFKEEIYDYCGGIEDLAHARVVFIGDPEIRIQEDYLRILRFLRFSSRYSNRFDMYGLRACINLRHNLIRLSKERIKWEIDKIIATGNFEFIFETMSNTGILQIIFPILHFDAKRFEKINSFIKGKDIQINSCTKYALIFYGAPNLSIEQLIDLKFSKREATTIFNLIEFANNFDNLDVQFLLKKVWLEKDNYLDYITACVGVDKLDALTAEQFIADYRDTPKPQFSINGNDLIKLGIHGEILGKILINLKNQWIRSNFTSSKSQLLNILHDKNE